MARGLEFGERREREAQLEEERARQVVPVARTPLHQPLVLQAAENPVRRALVEIAVVREIGQPPAESAARRQLLQQDDGSLDALRATHVFTL
jgi:hypothetical protein